MNGYKSILTSKTFWGAVVAVYAAVFPSHVAYLLSLFGVTDQMMLAAKIVSVLGGVFSIYGRIAAKKLVTLTGKPPA
jgi:hypothetical protein